MLETGDHVEGQRLGTVQIGAELGKGGQGAVFRGTTSQGEDVAIKWYLPAAQGLDLRSSISELVKRRPPSKQFLWPRDLVTRGSEFGYLMDLRPPSYSNIPRLLKRTVKVNFPELMLVAIRTVSAFRALQAQGLFYCDISSGNLFFNPRNGDVLICDNDNVGSPSARPKVLGTPRYMAPEIVRGEATPSPLTDSFSMAILLFLLLCNDHPLQGAAEAKIRCWDPAAMKMLYGTSPVFIFDPNDHSNRPVPGIHRNAEIFWDLYPSGIKKVFTRVFTAGLNEPGARPSFAEWLAALSAAADAIVTCACGETTFSKDDRSERRCWSCKKIVKRPMHLALDGRRLVALNPDTKLYAHHLRARISDTGERDVALAEVVKHPIAGVLGLRNLSSEQWWLKTPSGEAKGVEPGRAATLNQGTDINFGDVAGRIVI